MGLYNTHTWYAQSPHRCKKKKSRKITVVWWVQKPYNPTPVNRTHNENWLGIWAKKMTLEGLHSPANKPWPNSPQQSTRRSANTRTHSVKRLSGIDSNLSRAQNTGGKGRRTQIKEKGDKEEISEQGSSFLGMSYWTDGSSEELSWHLLKTNWCWRWWNSTVCLSWSNFRIILFIVTV